MTRSLKPCVLGLLLFALPWTDGRTHGLEMPGAPVLHLDFGREIAGVIAGARTIPEGSGTAVFLDGVDDYVYLGSPEALRLTGPLSLEAWVFPEEVPQGEPAIAGKHFNRFLLTYYSNGKAYWYIGDGGNNCQAVLSPGGWNHIVGTFDGEWMSLYIGGRLADRRKSKHPSIDPTGSFWIGHAPSDPLAEDPAQAGGRHFHGKIDELRVYDRALTAEEVRDHFLYEGRRIAAGGYTPIEAVASIDNASATVGVGQDGSVRVQTRLGEASIRSRWSQPGEEIKWNTFGHPGKSQGEPWKVLVEKTSVDRIRVSAESDRYRLVRTLHLAGDMLRFEDELKCLGQEPVGVIVDHEISAPTPFADVVAPGGPECPAILIASKGESFGLLVEDDIGRRKFEPRVGMPAASAGFRIGQLALRPNHTCTLRWSLILLPEQAGFLNLADRIRREWGSNFTIEGPIEWFDIGSRAALLEDPEALEVYFQRKKQGLVLLMPWLDYDPGSFPEVWSREEYKQRMGEAAEKIRRANPGGKVLGCIETDWVTLELDKIPGGDRLPIQGAGNIRLSTEETAILDRSGLPFLDSVRRDEHGRIIVEAYQRGGKQQAALGVYPAVGNHQFEFLMDQVVFLLDEVGLDGYYIDEFSQAYRNDLRDYGGWDRCSADLDSKTGEILRTYIDCSLAGIEARVRLIQAALDRGKAAVANTYSTSLSEQSLPVMRFSETQTSFNPFAYEIGEKPPFVTELLRGSLASPIGLGIVSNPNHPNRADTLGRAVMSYLRHGVLYAHYALGDVPPEEGEYGVVNHLFPITPIELGEGILVGRERTVTVRSGEFPAPRTGREPTVRAFDLLGRELPPPEWVWSKEKGTVALKGRDWTFFALIE